jgi:hypothetical protein
MAVGEFVDFVCNRRAIVFAIWISLQPTLAVGPLLFAFGIDAETINPPNVAANLILR